MDVETPPTWTPPQHDPSLPPRLLSSSQLVQSSPTNFVRSAKWSPDGSVALANCEDRSFRFLELPPELAESTLSRTVFHQPAPIIEYLWYPTASTRDAASFCYIASVRDCPVKLLDAATGRLRASYSIVDHRERHIAPHSLAFNSTCTKLYCGFEDAIEVFDVHRPGMDQGNRLFTTPSKKSRDGLKGIVSALAFCPDPTTDYFAAGTLTPTNFNIALFSESTAEKPLMWIGSEDLASGVIQLKFNPTNPSILYTAFRRRSEIYSWDLRGDVSIPLQTLRPHEGVKNLTNQKMQFDVDLSGRWLATGDQRGSISMFDLQDSSPSPVLRYNAHSDAIGSVAFHPLKPVLLSVSGSRHFDDDSSSEDSSSDDDAEHDVRRAVAKSRCAVSPVDSTIKFWDFAAERHVSAS